MRVGLIARADDTGLGVQTQEFFNHMNPDKTMVVNLSHINRKKFFGARYPSATFLTYTPYPEVAPKPKDALALKQGRKIIDEFLEDLDVVFSCETVYDHYLTEEAARRGVKVVLQYNYELLDYMLTATLPRPDLLVAPSWWNFHKVKLSIPKVFLPVPVDRAKIPAVERTQARTFLHIGGNPAMEDRNGTQFSMDAWQQVKTSARLHVRSQTGNFRANDHRIKIHRGSLANYADLYNTGDVFVMPRKFGGLCLPLNEALSAAMPIVMTDLSPQNQFLPPEGLISARKDRAEMMKVMVDIYEPDPAEFAAKIDELFNSPPLVQELSNLSNDIADKISWTTLKPLYDDMLSAVVEGKKVEQEFNW